MYTCIIIYVCIKISLLCLTTVVRYRQNRRRSFKELGYKEKGDSQNSLECSISTFICVILINFHVFMMIFCYFLTSRSTEMARQNKFVLIYIVELSKPYRMVIKSWKSVQAKQIVPLFTRVHFSLFARRCDHECVHPPEGLLWEHTIQNHKGIPTAAGK